MRFDRWLLQRLFAAGRLLRAFRLRNKGTLIHIHEDDWGLRTLVPIAAGVEIAADMAASREAAEAHRDPSGHGWTGVHVIEPPSTDYGGAGLTVAAAAAVLEPIMPRVKRFYATATAGFSGRDAYGSYNNDAWCFGRGRHCFIKLDVKEGLVREIWFDLSSSDPDDVAAVKRSMEAIDQLVPSLIADYNLDAHGAVADPKFLGQYFELLKGED